MLLKKNTQQLGCASAIQKTKHDCARVFGGWGRGGGLKGRVPGNETGQEREEEVRETAAELFLLGCFQFNSLSLWKGAGLLCPSHPEQGDPGGA